jgi:hypothetical protein
MLSRKQLREVIDREEPRTWSSDLPIFQNHCKLSEKYGLYLSCDPYLYRGQTRILAQQIPFFNKEQLLTFSLRGEHFTQSDKLWLLEFMASHVNQQSKKEIIVRAIILGKDGLPLDDNLHPDKYKPIQYK